MFAQVNNIRNRAKDNQNDRNTNRTFTPPANNNSGNNNTYTPSPRRTEPSNPNNNYQPRRQENNYDWYSRPSRTKEENNNTNNERSNNTSADYIHTDQSCNDCSQCCVGIEGFFNDFIKHQEFLVQSRVVNPKIYSAEFFALSSYNAYYESNVSRPMAFPPTFLFQPRLRLNWALLSTELRYSNLYTHKQGEYETTDWQMLILNLVSKREFYLRIGSGFMYEKFTNTYYNEHSLSTEILLDRRLSGVFDFRFSHDRQTQILPRMESGIRFNYKLVQGNYIDLDYTVGFQYQNYYQTDRLYLLQTGFVFMVH